MREWDSHLQEEKIIASGDGDERYFIWRDNCHVVASHIDTYLQISRAPLKDSLERIAKPAR